MERKKEWQNVRLGDYISIKSGLAYKGCHIGKGESLLLGMGCVSFKEKFIESGARPYNDPSDDRFVVKPGDIVLATRQQSNNLPILAMPAIIPFKYKNKRVLFGTNLYKVENKSEIDNRFLFWLLKHQHYVNYIAGVKSGTAVQMVTKKNVEDYKFNCPPKSIRDKISNILWTYDTLIENNNRRIRLLEQMAENLYKEWFVRFRFPGHEKLENGLPKEWTIKRVKDCVERLPFGRTYKVKELYKEGKVIVVDQSTSDYLGYHNDVPAHYASFESPIILFGDHSCKFYLMTRDFSLGENIIPFKSKDKNQVNEYYLFFATHNLIKTEEYKRHWGRFSSMKIVIPKIELQQKFNKLIREYEKMKRYMYSQNTLLTRQRDLLLPRLMSGKLEVKP
ncbi:restriction endonuclease subunit S [Prevotella intermedia]|uniref:Restriction endonuclease subunit S n=1 Tax=Prevotella intermedia TaxID=28131 RepID=A0A424ZAN7_PREIN|nr:restriction endonuclease subunit S [Prevotella intermedia]RQE06564.1 restriction endonuclease subunit S [Prevotella intermedia]RRF87966.1 restriction endonuclease subunit S [Prevotella intermedia]